jgi:transcriptional regulator with XRE-family HTH domain
MDEKDLNFGDYIRKKRLRAGLTLSDVSAHLDFSRSYLSDIENQRKGPFNVGKLKLFAEQVRLTDEETALLYDIASRESHIVPHDIRGILMHEEVGELARTALRISKGVTEPEENWKQLIRDLEKNKRNQSQS